MKKPMVSQGFSTIFHRLLQEGGPPRIRQQVVGTKGRRRKIDPMFADLGLGRIVIFHEKWVIFRKKLLY